MPLTWLSPIRERVEKATTGPWHCDERVGVVAVYAGDLKHCLAGERSQFIHSADGEPDGNGSWTVDPGKVADARLIANAPTDLSRLLRAVEVLEEALEQIERHGDDDDAQGASNYHRSVARRALADVQSLPSAPSATESD